MSYSRSLIFIILAVSVISAVITFYRFYLQKDYMVYANVPCDPQQHLCFIGDGENTPDFFSKVAKKASLITPCNGWADKCSPLSCTEGEPKCEQTFCTPDNPDEPCFGKEI